MKKIYSIALGLLAVSLFISSCKKKFDLPPVKDIPVSGYIKIDSIYKKFIDYYLGTGPAPTKLFRFNTDINLKCLVTADETSGNIYKTVYVQDVTGGLTIKLLNSGGLAAGDSIRINLNGIALDNYGNTVQLDSIDIYDHVVKLSSGNIVTPIKLTMNQAKATTTGSFLQYQSRLILLDSVEFYGANKNVPYADAVGKYSLDRPIINAAGTSMIVRTSGYSKFAGYITPCGKGSVTAILTEYNGDPQLTIRDVKEVKLLNDNCPFIGKGFDGEPSVLYGGWTMENVIGTTKWTIDEYSSRIYGYISNYANSSNQLCETWLISPAMNLTGAPSPKLSFMSAQASFPGPTLQVLVSTNYNSGNPNLATWTPLSVTLSAGSYNWVSSGNVALSSYISSNTRIAFKYSGTATSGATWEIDDIIVLPQ